MCQMSEISVHCFSWGEEFTTVLTFEKFRERHSWGWTLNKITTSSWRKTHLPTFSIRLHVRKEASVWLSERTHARRTSYAISKTSIVNHDVLQRLRKTYAYLRRTGYAISRATVTRNNSFTKNSSCRKSYQYHPYIDAQWMCVLMASFTFLYIFVDRISALKSIQQNRHSLLKKLINGCKITFLQHQFMK